jgi:rubrerythrin
MSYSKGVILDFQQSKTYINLLNALENELKTNAKLQLFRKKAGQDELLECRYIFDTAARNCEFISERLRRIVYGGDPSTLDNLLEASADAENAEKNMYREYSRIALEEGYQDISALFNGIGNIKLNHNVAFHNTAMAIQKSELFCKPTENLWICLGCGNIIGGLCAPEICPICGYPQGYYQLYCQC